MAEATPVPAVAPVDAAPAAPEAPKAPEAPAAAKPTASESRVFAEAARKERAIQAEKAAWKAQRAKEEAAWQERIAKAQAVEEKLAKAKKEPLTALEALGLSYEELTIAQLNEGKPGADLAVRAAEEKIAALEAKIEADKKAAAEEAAKKQAESEKATVAAWHDATAKWVSGQADKYELVNALGYQREVGRMIEEHYDATGEEVPREVAAEKLEAHLQSMQDPAMGETWKRVTSTKWFQSRYAPVAKKEESKTPPPPRRSSDPEVPAKKAEAHQPPAAPTISNKMTASYPNAKSPAAATREQLRAIAHQKYLQGTGG